MRKKLLTSTLIGALIVLAVIVGSRHAGCGHGCPGSAQASRRRHRPGHPEAGALRPGGHHQRDRRLQRQRDGQRRQDQAAGGRQALLGQPITMSRARSRSTRNPGRRATINASIAGQNLPLGHEDGRRQSLDPFHGPVVRGSGRTDGGPMSHHHDAATPPARCCKCSRPPASIRPPGSPTSRGR